MSVHYKFKSTLDYDTVSFDGLHISVADLKKAIFHQKRIGKNTDFDLQITNAQTKEDYTDDNALIAKNTSLIVARVPLTIQQKRSWDRNEQPAFANSKDESNMGRSVDLTRLDGSEEDKIRAMMTQSTQDYDPSNYMKIRGANQTGEVPPNYRCYKCHQPGHWIKNCPSGIDREPIEIKKSTGIPRSFMVPVEGPLVPGAMMTPTGHYAVPAIDHQAYKEGKKERPPFAHDPEPVVEKPEIPEDLLCNICKDLLTDAVMIPCCGNSFCDECIRTVLLESEEHECPDCSEKDVSPETLIPNRFLRNAVMNFKNETGYAKRQTYRPTQAASSQQPLVKLEKPKVENVQPASSQESGQSGAPTSQTPIASSVPSQEFTEKPADLAEPATSTVPQQYDEPPPPALVAPASTESPPEPETRADTVTKLITDEETEVPPPPGTEPLLPIPALGGSSPDRDLERGVGKVDEKKDQEDDYSDDQRPRERRRSFSKDSHRERSGDHGRRIENLRTVSRRRSLSPRNSHRGEYLPSSHPMNHPASKNYQVPPPGNARYQPNMHYCADERDIRRSTEERPGTPTVDEPHLHGPPSVGSQQPPLLPYPPGEDRLPAPPPAQPPQPNYNQPPPNIAPHNALLPDPYMAHRIPLYPHQQGGPHYGPPRYDRPPYQQTGYRGSQIPRNYNGPPRPMRGMHHLGYRGVQPPPPGLGRTINNGNPPGVIDDPLEAFERMLREKDERDRRLGKHRRRSRTRSRSRSYTRSRSRSFGRRSPLPARISRSRSPPPKRRASRSPLPMRQRSRTPKRRSRSGSFSISRSRSYSRSQSPRGSLSRDRERDRERERERDRERDRERERDLPPRYRSPVRSPPRFHRERERERERPRSREPREPPSGGGYNSYYNDSPAHDYGFRDRERELPPPPRERPGGGARYPPRNHSSSQHNIPPLLPHLLPGGPSTHVHQPPPLMSLGPPPPDRKDYYDSYNRYSGPGPQRFAGSGSPLRDTTYKRPFDDVAPPGTEGYYDLPPPGVDHPEKFPREDREKSRLSKEHEERERVKEQDVEDRERLPIRDDRNRERDERMDRGRERDERGERRIMDRERERERERDRDRDDQRERPPSGREHQDRMREKEERERREKEKERDERHVRDRRDEERQIDKRDYDKERYRDDRERHRIEDKSSRGRERDRKDRDYEMDKERERHERYEGHSADRKKAKKSSSPHPPKSRNDVKETASPERVKRKDKDHEERSDEKKKDKKIKEKKKKKDGEEKEKKKKKKKEKRSTQKDITKDDAPKATACETADSRVDEKLTQHNDGAAAMKVEEILRSETVTTEESVEPPKITMLKETFEDKSLAMNPEPPEVMPDDKGALEAPELGTNPPNPNFKPIPEAQVIAKPVESLYGGLDDRDINETVVPDKYSLHLTGDPEEADEEEEARVARPMQSTSEEDTTSAISTGGTSSSLTATQSTKVVGAPETDEKSPKKDEFLAQLPELSKWEREETTEKSDAVVESPSTEEPTAGVGDESKSTKVVTSEVLKRAENAIFQKAINAIRPIEIKKISESRKILYQNPEPKIIEPEPARAEPRKSVNVTINVGRNERNVEITEPSKKANKLDRTKFKPVPESHSPTRLSAKERLGDKVDDEKDRKTGQAKNFMERRDSSKSEAPQQRSRSPRGSRDRRSSPTAERRADPPNVSNSERKVFLDDRKRDRERNERPRDRIERHESRGDSRSDARDTRDTRIDNRMEFRSSRNESRSERSDRERSEKERERADRRARTPPAQTNKREDAAKPVAPKRKETTAPTASAADEEVEKKKEKKPKEEKKRKKEHRSRSKSKDRKRRKEKKHKKDKEKAQEKKQKHKESSVAAAAVAAAAAGAAMTTATVASLRDKGAASDVKKSLQEASENNPRAETSPKKQRKNPRLVSDRKRSVLDEASFEPDYSASDSDSDGEDGKSATIPSKKPKLEAASGETLSEKTTDAKPSKKRVKSTSSEDYSTSDSDSSSSDTDSSEDSHRKRKKKHKKHKKRKSKKESSTDSDSYSDSSYTSSDDRHKKKAKKSKSKSKQAKKKKKARHK